MSKTDNTIIKECITTAFVKLLKSKPISKISITEISKVAGVSRMTFYRTFTSKEEILTNHLYYLIDKFRIESKELYKNNVFEDIEALNHCFAYCNEYREFIAVIFKAGFSTLFLQAIIQYLLDAYYKPGDSIRKYYSLQCYAGAIYNAYATWDKNNHDISAQELSELIHEYFVNKNGDSIQWVSNFYYKHFLTILAKLSAVKP